MRLVRVRSSRMRPSAGRHVNPDARARLARSSLIRPRRSRGPGAAWLWLLAGGAATSILAATLVLTVIAASGVGAAAAAASTLLTDVPEIDEILDVGSGLFQTTTIVDRRGRPLGELLGQGRRTLVPPEAIPADVKAAVIAAEDATFYENPGVELRAIVRALWQNFTGGEIVSGASTITQQLVKNVLLTPEETVERKVKEAVLAWQLSERFSKDEILGLYLNQNYYGSLSYGVAAAARTYFGKSLNDVTLAEAALLAGILRSPSTDNPHVDPAAARREQLRVLNRLEETGLAPPARVEAARREVITIMPPQPAEVRAPHFFRYVLDEVQARYGPDVSWQGWRIITTLDLDLQQHAETAAREHVAALADETVTNAALVALRPGTGEVLAMVGSLDFNDATIDGQVNVTLAPRQPGSAFKPITYASALQRGYTPATMLLDIPTIVPIVGQEPYAPRNYSERFSGPVSVRTALGSSLNIPAVRTQLFAGLVPTVDLAEQLGITTLTDPSRIGPALALGSNEVRLIELTSAYGVFANEGRAVAPTGILCILDARGRVIEQLGDDGCSARVRADVAEAPSRIAATQVISAGLAFLMTSILSDDEARVLGFGEVRRNLQLPGRAAAAKTGTTEDTRDALTVGYTPQLVTGVWVGNADGTPMDEVTGVRGAAPIWQRFMSAALEGQPALAWPQPATVAVQEIDALSGLLPSPFTPETREEFFLAGTVPVQRDMVHQPFDIHVPTGLLATPDTPLDEVEEQVFVVLPTEADEWQRTLPEDSPLRLPPEAFVAAVAPTGASERAAITRPVPLERVRSVLDIQGTAAGPLFAEFELRYGAGPAPGSWVRIGAVGVSPVTEEPLRAIDTSQLPDGPYTLRLVVRAANGREDLVFRRFVVDNTPPAVAVAGLANGDERPAGVLELRAALQDAGGLAAVAYEIDGEEIGEVQRAPYRLRWTAEPGTYTLRAIATDRAGNQTASDAVTFTVR